MKRELAQILDAKSQLGETRGRTRSSHAESRANSGVNISVSSSSKRFRGCVVDGVIVYTRGRKTRSNAVEDEKAETVEKSFAEAEAEAEAKSQALSANTYAAEECPEGSLVEVAIVEESNCEMEVPIKVEPFKELQQSLGGGTAEVLVPKADGIPQENGSPQVALRRFTRSALKQKVEELETVAEESAQQVVENEMASTTDGKTNNVGVVSPATSKNKLELKMSKKIALNKKPTTVKELFDTGLVEGVAVVYMGGKKACGLRGTIKDGGILCSCAFCKGCRVIPPSQFEIHACKQYRRAAQYICLENGKSLLDLLKACRGVSLHTLEATVQSFISSSPDETYFTCKRCRVSYPPLCAAKDGSLCNSCFELENPQCSSTDDVLGILHSSPMPVPVSVSQSPKTAPVHVSSPIKRDWTLTRKSSIPLSTAKASKSCPPQRSSSPKKRGKKMGTKSKKPLSLKKSLKKASAVTTSKKKGHLITKSPKSASATISPQKKAQWKITTKDIRLHKLVFEDGGLPDGSEVAYYARGKKLLEGYKKGAGIFCRCCNCEVSPSQFEAHAGWASRRKPYAYIYTSNGVSLHELAVSLSKGRKYSANDNDDLCIICADGGNLLLCDGCPRAFHRECASLSTIPRGDWYCQYCQNMFQRENFVERNANAFAAGRISGVDPIEEITMRCIRIVKNIEAELSGCVLCRGHDFSKSGFGPRTIILCDQCEKEYHVGCLKKNKMANLKELPQGNWFCCSDCSNIHTSLQKLLVFGAEKIPDSLLDIMKKKHVEKGLDTSIGFDVSWRLINGKIASPDSRVLLSKAVAIFHECFDPIIDFQSGRDLIPAMVYGRNVRGQEFGGMYCAILTVNSTVVSAAMLRVFGQEIAELPLVATSNNNHGKGYFQLLFSCIEKLLAFLNVKSLVLPAAEEAESIWTEKFGFAKIAPDQLINYRKICYQMVTFQGTSMLEKKVPKCRVIPM